MGTSQVIELLVWLLIAASVIGVLAARLRVPYTVALVIGGLALGSLHHLPILQSLAELGRTNWLTPDIVLVLFLPPLLFEGSIKIDLFRLRQNVIPIVLLATLGVLAATLITGVAVHWAFGAPWLVALIFGAIVSPTDPVSVIAIFEEMGVDKRLTMILEGESLFNDGTAVVLYGILVAGFSAGRLGVATGFEQFVVIVLGAVAVGAILGYAFSAITQRINEPRIEITLTTILAYSSYLVADAVHLSGVIAVASAGIVLGNVGARRGMSARTRVAVWSFWEYASFVINSLLFLIIGMRVHIGELAEAWQATLLAVGAVLLGRAIPVYSLVPVSNIITTKVPLRWQPVLIWGGLRGALALALALSLPATIPFRDSLLAWTFGVVAFSIIIQGLTIKPLLRLLGMCGTPETDYSRARVLEAAFASARQELDHLLNAHVLSKTVHARLRSQLDSELQKVEEGIAALYAQNAVAAEEELNAARVRLTAAERSAIQGAVYDGTISPATAAALIDEAGRHLDELLSRVREGPPVLPENSDGSGTTPAGNESPPRP